MAATTARARAMLSRDGVVQAVSAEYASALQRPSDLLTDRLWFDLVHPEDRELVRERWRAALEGEPPEEVTIRLWSGSETWIDSRLRLSMHDEVLVAVELVEQLYASASSHDVPGPAVPEARVRARARAGGADAPMVEIDRPVAPSSSEATGARSSPTMCQHRMPWQRSSRGRGTRPKRWH